MEIRLARTGDIGGWMALVERVRDGFPGLETREALDRHRDTVMEFIRRDEAVCAVEGGRLVGALLFSKETGTLCFLAVDERFRRRHIAADMTAYMLTFLPPEQEITVTTYREGTPQGAAARAFYKGLGFTEGELTEEFGSPVQVFRRNRTGESEIG